MRTTLDSIYRYNYKRSLVDHDTVQRTYALNDEAAVVVCDYGKAPRPHIPFPYYAEAWTGLEHSTAALMFYSGMIPQGVEYVENLRARYDGVKRNPWDEAECGHHYARAMSSWSSVVALSGFHYEGDRAHVIALPRLPHENFHCFWATGTGWGTYSLKRTQSGGSAVHDQDACRHFAVQVLHAGRARLPSNGAGRQQKKSPRVWRRARNRRRCILRSRSKCGERRSSGDCDRRMTWQSH